MQKVLIEVGSCCMTNKLSMRLPWKKKWDKILPFKRRRCYRAKAREWEWEREQVIHSEIQSMLHDLIPLNDRAHVSKSFQFLVRCYNCSQIILYGCNLSIDNNANSCEYWFDERWICFDIDDTQYFHMKTRDFLQKIRCTFSIAIENVTMFERIDGNLTHF